MLISTTCNGYMSPEYVLDGLFSIKSDIFSFEVLLLKIISGKKNKGFFHNDPYSNSIQYVSCCQIFCVHVSFVSIGLKLTLFFSHIMLEIRHGNSGEKIRPWR
ncbi:hypothetical protein ACOSQ4_009662 [Xanthoceras sorbifolium]